MNTTLAGTTAPGEKKKKKAMLKPSKKHPHAQPAPPAQPAFPLFTILGACCVNRTNLRRNRGLALSTAFYPTPPLLTKAPKVITMKKWVSITPTLTMFSKNEDNKHKSLHSKQELSAFNAKKQQNKTKKTEILRQILLTLHTGWMTL